MELTVLSVTSRGIVTELTESGKYYSKDSYDIYINGEKYLTTDKIGRASCRERV